jgi:single-stranded-DNA-specific exonuclease
LLYGDSDRRINDYIIAKSAPSLPMLREIYRGLRGLRSLNGPRSRDGLASDGAESLGEVRSSYEDIARTLDLEMTDGSTIGAAVRIFEEAGLIETGIDDEGRFLRFREVAAKVDLTKTARYAEGLADREAFDRFCGLALGADAPTLEQIINRPIYPDGVALEA